MCYHSLLSPLQPRLPLSRRVPNSRQVLPNRKLWQNHPSPLSRTKSKLLPPPPPDTSYTGLTLALFMHTLLQIHGTVQLWNYIN